MPTSQCPTDRRTVTGVLAAVLLTVPLLIGLSGCGGSGSGDNEAIDETKLPENNGIEYGEVESKSASTGGLMRFDDDNLRIFYSDHDADSGRGAFSIMHKANPEFDRDVVAPNGTVLVVGEYRVRLETNSSGDAGFGDVAKAIVADEDR